MFILTLAILYFLQSIWKLCGGREVFDRSDHKTAKSPNSYATTMILLMIVVHLSQGGKQIFVATGCVAEKGIDAGSLPVTFLKS